MTSAEGGAGAVCVFCGAKPDVDEVYLEAARGFGELLASEGSAVVFGAGCIGMMGALADGAIAAGGRTIGVIPETLVELELAHPEISELHVVQTMHERKGLMHELSDSLVALPGGLGTFEEILEALTWAVLKYHTKPVALLDVNDYWGPLIASLDTAVEKGFFRADHRALLIVESDPARLYERLSSWRDPDLPIV